MMEVYKRKRDITFLGTVGLCAVTKEQFVKELFDFPTTPVSATVNFIGVPGVISAKENPKVAEVFAASTFAAMDGMPLVKAAGRTGIDCERCAGPNVMVPVFQESVRQGKTHYFYGGKDENVLKKLKNNLECRYPGIQIVGMYSPPFRPLTREEDKMVVEEINALQPDFLWVGIGSPKQDIWMQEHREEIKGTVMLGVGAAFDFFAGTLKKAPEWVEKAGIEWLYRLLKEPKRLWRRYIIGGVKWIWYSLTDRTEAKPISDHSEKMTP